MICAGECWQPVPRPQRSKLTLIGNDAGSQDEDLADAQSGQASAFAALVRAHQAAVYSLALRMLADREQARDLAQEVFLQLYRKLLSIESARHLKFWLRKVTTNLVIDRMRSRPAVVFTTLDDGEQFEYEAADDDPLLQRQLRQYLYELPVVPRAVMLLRYQEDLDPIDIAAALDMPINTVKSHLKRSLSFMKQRILGAMPESREGS